MDEQRAPGLSVEELEADFKAFLANLRSDQSKLATQALNAVDRRYPNHDLQAMMTLMSLVMNRHTRFVMDILVRNNQRIAEQFALERSGRPATISPEARPGVDNP